MELLLLSLPRLPSFGGSDPPSRDSLPAPIMRASKRLSFRSVLESLFPITGGKFSIGMPESSIFSAAEAGPPASRPGSLRSGAPNTERCLVREDWVALPLRGGSHRQSLLQAPARYFVRVAMWTAGRMARAPPAAVLYLPLRLWTVQSNRDTPRANSGRWRRIRGCPERQV